MFYLIMLELLHVLVFRNTIKNDFFFRNAYQGHLKDNGLWSPLACAFSWLIFFYFLQALLFSIVILLVDFFLEVLYINDSEL